MPSTPWTRLLALAVAGALLLGCSDGGATGDDTGATDGTEEEGELSPVPDPLESLAEPPPGQGVGVIGIQELSFDVTSCTEGPEEDDTAEATLELRVRGEGELSEGPFAVEVTRYRSDTGDGPPVVTETAQVRLELPDGPAGIEAKRTTAGADGAWLDLTDPDVDEPLIDRADGAIDVRGTFGPAGARAGDEGLEQGRIRASCPA